MSFLTIYETPELSNELSNLLTDIKDNFQSYTKSRTEAQKQRMIIIGKVVEYQRQFPQRSNEHKLLSQAMSEEGWSEDVITNNVSAYKAFKQLSANSNPEFRHVTEVASVSQLKEIGSSTDSTLTYDAAIYLKRNGKLPSVNAMRGHKADKYSSKFEPLRKAMPQHKEPVVNEKQVVEVSPTEVVHHTEEVVTLAPEIEIENEVSVFTPDAPTPTNPLIDDVYRLSREIKELKKSFLSKPESTRSQCAHLIESMKKDIDRLSEMSYSAKY